ncbi:hypothetical protein NC651_032016 [Populus alba x Populus x berolinensis]|nr:hypothetical protein NC651_032016 [Populus alba x Populus x berolinensis]
MPVMEKLRRFVAQDPVVAFCSSSSQFRASINDHSSHCQHFVSSNGFFNLFENFRSLPSSCCEAMLDSLEGRKHVPERQPSISDVSI